MGNSPAAVSLRKGEQDSSVLQEGQPEGPRRTREGMVQPEATLSQATTICVLYGTASTRQARRVHRIGLAECTEGHKRRSQGRQVANMERP